jgi:hypothetical protein
MLTLLADSCNALFLEHSIELRSLILYIFYTRYLHCSIFGFATCETIYYTRQGMIWQNISFSGYNYFHLPVAREISHPSCEYTRYLHCSILGLRYYTLDILTELFLR